MSSNPSVIQTPVQLILNDQQTFNAAYQVADFALEEVLLHKDLKCKAPLIEPNLRRNLGKWST
ncbi:hypothetical protein [Acinetobacter haemolyticus]|uniref:hypothetical protein n=1 Tax=Acinetobacter haemolyticus TaxID=29430 RepID=UPI001331C82F|nr:hypothetical protein [Acinetobacter haemolyticus]NAS01218.1 hypothetical protein [Acinetobacter haemolyticus]NAS08593.1 hypothetical protein [Acinetobacter haemolyticus]QHI29747.1 hypothetical protein AhaeINNSZ174_09860 [Acinetobacter haemolyticus]QHI32514.1 hypothetical protein Ahae11616_07550 [Acinetobacter haemolyticus]